MENALSFNFFTLIYFSALVAMLAAYFEFYNIGRSANKNYYDKEYVNNSVLIIDSINCILNTKRGELTVFLYPFTLISISIMIYLSLKIEGIHFSMNLTPSFLLISSFIVSLHVIVPYQFTYLKQARKAIEKDFSVKEWFNYAFFNIKTLDSLDSLPISPNSLSFEEYNSNDYNKYVSKVKELQEIDKTLDISPLSERVFRMHTPFFDKHSIYFLLNKEETKALIDETNLILNKTETRHSVILSSIFSEENINFLLMQRFFEIALFFGILNILYINKL